MAGIVVITVLVIIVLVVAFSMGRSLAWQHQELDKVEERNDESGRHRGN